MKSRYNLRIQSVQPCLSTINQKVAALSSSRVSKKLSTRPSRSYAHRRQSLRLTPVGKQAKRRRVVHETSAKKTDNKPLCHAPRWRHVENESEDESVAGTHDTDSDYDDVLARHHRLMLEEQKDRKLYERYVRDQRTLRRLQCRRTHSAHLNDATRNRLLRELERERRYTIQDKISAHLANHTIIYRHGCNIESDQPMNWSSLEAEIPCNRNIGTIHELDVMIGNLKKVMQNSKSSLSKPRLSVRERQNQRLKPTSLTKTNLPKTPENNSSPAVSNPTLTLPTQLAIISHSPRIPVVRFVDDQNNKLRISNSQRLTCIQNVLSHQSNTNQQNRTVTNEASSPTSIRKSFLRPKSTYLSLPDISPSKKRPLEKENCSILSTSTPPNIVLRATAPMVSIKYTPFSSSSRTYPNTRKHPVIRNSLTKRRQTRLSATG